MSEAQVTDLTPDNYESALADAELAVIDFYAGWCGPCRMFAPKYRKLAKVYPGVRFFKLDGETHPEIRKALVTEKIETLPYFALYKGGEQIAGFSTQKADAFQARLEADLGVTAEGA